MSDCSNCRKEKCYKRGCRGPQGPIGPTGPASTCNNVELNILRSECDATGNGLVTYISHGNGIYTVEIYLNVSGLTENCSVLFNWPTELNTGLREYTMFSNTLNPPELIRVNFSSTLEGLVLTVDDTTPQEGRGYVLDETFLVCSNN